MEPDDGEFEIVVALPYREIAPMYEVNPSYRSLELRNSGAPNSSLPPLAYATIVNEEPSLKRESPPPSITLDDVRTPQRITDNLQRVISPVNRPAGNIETGLEVGMQVLARRFHCGDNRFEGVIVGLENGNYEIDFGYDDIETVSGGYGNVIRHPSEDMHIFRMRAL